MTTPRGGRAADPSQDSPEGRTGPIPAPTPSIPPRLSRPASAAPPLRPRPPPGSRRSRPLPPARRPPGPCGSAAAERGLQEPREGRRGRGPRRRFARSGNRQPSTSAPYCAAPPPGLQYGRRGGAKSLQPFPLPVPASSPLAGRSSRRKGRKRRKHAMPRRRRRVLWLPARTAPLQRLLSPRN